MCLYIILQKRWFFVKNSVVDKQFLSNYWQKELRRDVLMWCITSTSKLKFKRYIQQSTRNIKLNLKMLDFSTVEKISRFRRDLDIWALAKIPKSAIKIHLSQLHVILGQTSWSTLILHILSVTETSVKSGELWKSNIWDVNITCNLLKGCIHLCGKNSHLIFILIFKALQFQQVLTDLK